jgi:hypothetical protein
LGFGNFEISSSKKYYFTIETELLWWYNILKLTNDFTARTMYVKTKNTVKVLNSKLYFKHTISTRLVAGRAWLVVGSAYFSPMHPVCSPMHPCGSKGFCLQNPANPERTKGAYQLERSPKKNNPSYWNAPT